MSLQPHPSDSPLPGRRADPAPDPGLTAPVKLVVWDLDDTLWTGTLSEGPVVVDPGRLDVVRTLNRRGIVNSVCSNNDDEQARARLEELALWDELVFPSIEWTPKGARVAAIVQDMQLRPENVLFIDDVRLNREQVRTALPGIQVADPEIIDRLLSLPQLAGKDDAGLTRLEQYRMLERKRSDRVAATTSSEDFLRSCDIRVSIDEVGVEDLDRVLELVHRTNQLNFTKRRPGDDELRSLLGDPSRRSGSIRVRDRYGDYGVCGFFSLGPSGDVLEDFLFSCRIMNMGVEQWVYQQLRRPRLSVVGEVASDLSGPFDWITDAAGAAGGLDDPRDPARSDGGSGPTPRILVVGGCDLESATTFLGGDIATDLHRTNDDGTLIHGEHLDLLRQAAAGITPDQRAVVRQLPMLDEAVFDPPAIRTRYDVLVYSLLMDYTQDRYRHRTSGLVVPWNQLDVDATDPSAWPAIEDRFGHGGIDGAFLAWFAEEFERIGALSPADLQDNLRWLSKSACPGSQVIVLNGAELQVDNPREAHRDRRHREMNRAVDEVVVELDNVTVCDVRPFVTGLGDLSPREPQDLRHYRRVVYLRIAQEIGRLTSGGVQVEEWRPRRQTVLTLRRLVSRCRRALGFKPRPIRRPPARPPTGAGAGAGEMDR